MDFLPTIFDIMISFDYRSILTMQSVLANTQDINLLLVFTFMQEEGPIIPNIFLSKETIFLRPKSCMIFNRPGVSKAVLQHHRHSLAD